MKIEYYNNNQRSLCCFGSIDGGFSVSFGSLTPNRIDSRKKKNRFAKEKVPLVCSQGHFSYNVCVLDEK